MIKTIKKRYSRDAIISVTCDKCGKIITPDDIVEWQEKHHIRFMGGYGSVFGDGEEIECDLCQQCFKELIGPYCRTNEGG